MTNQNGPKTNSTPEVGGRVLILKPSPTLALAQKARELQTKGHAVINLTVGEPDWATFPAAKKAGVQAIEENFTRYTAASGTPELKALLAQFCSRELELDVMAQEICVGTGAKFLIHATLQLLLNEGDEVLIPAPYWVSYPTMVEISGGKPRAIETQAKDRFKLTAELLRASVTSKTKLLILCSPSNPTGIAYTKDELRSLAEVLKSFPDLWILSDDIYNRLVLDEGLAEVSPHLLHVCPELRIRTVCINGASKCFAMTGWRIGWAVGPLSLMKPMSDYLSQTTSNPCSISQKALQAVLGDYQADLKSARLKLSRRLQIFKRHFDNSEDYDFVWPDGAFYLWVGVKVLIGKSYEGRILHNDQQLTEAMLEKAGLAVVPGSEFGCPGYIRLSFAVSDTDAEKACVKLKEFAANLT
jgi:aspartate aminotransferase